MTYAPRYNFSEHYREDPLAEVDAALTANSPGSVALTLESRLSLENKQKPRDDEAIQRIQDQLAYVATKNTLVEVIAIQPEVEVAA